MDADLTDEECRLLAADDRATARVGIWITVILAAIGGALLIWAWQLYTWLREGYWPALPVEMVLPWVGIDRPQSSWVGIQKLIDWLMGSPLSGFLIFTAIVLVFLFTQDDDRPTSEALRMARMKQARARSRSDEKETGGEQ